MADPVFETHIYVVPSEETRDVLGYSETRRVPFGLDLGEVVTVRPYADFLDEYNEPMASCEYRSGREALVCATYDELFQAWASFKRAQGGSDFRVWTRMN